MTDMKVARGGVKRKQPTAADEAKFPLASVVLDTVAAYVATTSASLLLLPVSGRKVALQLPRGATAPGSTSVLRSFAGSKATLMLSGLRFSSTALLPPPLSTLVSYFGSILLRGAVIRAQSGVFSVARTQLPKLTSARGLTALWVAHMTRDLPFLVLETYALTALSLQRLRVSKKRALEDLVSPSSGQENPRVRGRPGIQVGDAVIAGGLAGVLTVPLDLLHTRMFVAGRPSLLRISRAMFRLARRRGLLGTTLAVGSGSGSGLYIAECMAKPITQVSIYAVVRAAFVATLLRYKMRNELKTVQTAPPTNLIVTKDSAWTTCLGRVWAKETKFINTSRAGQNSTEHHHTVAAWPECIKST